MLHRETWFARGKTSQKGLNTAVLVNKGLRLSIMYEGDKIKRQSCGRCGPAGGNYQRKGERGKYNPLWESTDCGKTKTKQGKGGQMIIKGKQQELIHPHSQ